MFIRSVLLLVSLSVLLLRTTQGYAQEVVFKSISLPKESHWGHISDMAQDQQGYVWLATQNGVHRYNGYKFTTFLPSLSEANSIASNWT